MIKDYYNNIVFIFFYNLNKIKNYYIFLKMFNLIISTLRSWIEIFTNIFLAIYRDIKGILLFIPIERKLHKFNTKNDKSNIELIESTSLTFLKLKSFKDLMKYLDLLEFYHMPSY